MSFSLEDIGGRGIGLSLPQTSFFAHSLNPPLGMGGGLYTPPILPPWVLVWGRDAIRPSLLF